MGRCPAKQNDLGNGGPLLGATSPLLGATSPLLGATSPLLGATSPLLGADGVRSSGPLIPLGAQGRGRESREWGMWQSDFASLGNAPEKDNPPGPETRKIAKSAKKCDF